MSSATRNVCVTAVDGALGGSIAYLALRGCWSNTFGSITGLTLRPSALNLEVLKKNGAKIVEHVPGREKSLVNDLKKIGCDTICLVPPVHEDKFDITMELINAAKKAGVSNVLLISSAGADGATKEKQPRLREFIELETAVLSAQGGLEVASIYSPCVIRAGFEAEHFLFYSKQPQNEGFLPLPMGQTHKFAPVVGLDVATMATHVLAGQGKLGFDDRHCGQMMVVTGPMLCTGKELAEAVSEARGRTLEYEQISEAEAKHILKSLSHINPSEIEYILEYYSLVREGKTNYISTMAFHDVTGTHLMEPSEGCRLYAELRSLTEMKD